MIRICSLSSRSMLVRVQSEFWVDVPLPKHPYPQGSSSIEHRHRLSITQSFGGETPPRRAAIYKYHSQQPRSTALHNHELLGPPIAAPPPSTSPTTSSPPPPPTPPSPPSPTTSTPSTSQLTTSRSDAPYLLSTASKRASSPPPIMPQCTAPRGFSTSSTSRIAPAAETSATMNTTIS